MRCGSVFTTLCLVFSFSSTLLATPICEDWPKTRDQDLIVDFDKARKDYALTLDRYELWLNQLHDFNEEHSVTTAKMVAIADILLLGASVTAETVNLAMNLSGVNPTAPIRFHATKLALDIAQSNSTEEAALRMVGEKSGLFNNMFTAHDIIQSLIDGKERFKEHKVTIKLLKDTEAQLRRNLANSRMGLERSRTSFKDINDYKNKMDGICNIQHPSNATWVFAGYRIADYVGPPKSINRIPTRYGYYWILKNEHYSKNRKALMKTLKAENKGLYLDFKFSSPKSNQFVAIYQITKDVGTWKGPELEVVSYKFYAGKTQENIKKRLERDAKEYKYKSMQQVELLVLDDAYLNIPADAGNPYAAKQP